MRRAGALLLFPAVHALLVLLDAALISSAGDANDEAARRALARAGFGIR